MQCVACGSEACLKLPDLPPSRSITTSSMRFDTALDKGHCGNSVLVQRTRSLFLGLADFYAKNHVHYYDHPGNEGLSTTRYREIAECRPAVQSVIEERLKRTDARIVRWNGRISA
jgi:hypothetical protein